MDKIEDLKSVLLQVLHKIRQEKVKEFTWSDIHRHLEQVANSTSITILEINQVLNVKVNLNLKEKKQSLKLFRFSTPN